MANINKIKLSGTTYTIQDENATKTVELTQAQYDALSTKDPNTFYIITDAEAVDIANYYTKSETSGATQISTALNAKADTATTYTKTEVDTALAGKQATLVSGTNIKTINNESILGSGNIEIQGGGGKAVSAGTNISITTGETADTINCTLPIVMKYSNMRINSNREFANSLSNCFTFGGFNTVGNGNSCSYLVTFGSDNDMSASNGNRKYRYAFGTFLKTQNSGEIAFSKYNVSSSASETFGDSGNTLFSVGNGTANNARHNAFEIRQNGDIYCSDGTNDVKLQDTITATAANTTALGGLKLVKLSQSAYDALTTKDSMTLYIIVNETTDNDKVMIAWTSGDGTQGTNIVLWDGSVSLPPTDLFNSLTVNDVDVMSTVGQDGTLENYSTSNTNYLVKYELINDSTITNIFNGNLGGGWGSTVGSVDFLIPSQVTEIQMIPQNTGTLVILAETPPQCAFYSMFGGVYVPDNAVSTYESQWSGVTIYPISEYQGNLPV